MSGDNPCECVDIYNHENAMSRLITMLRDSQNACTDTGCENTSNDQSSQNCSEDYMLILLGWVILATLLYLLRSRSHRLKGDEKPFPSSGDGSGPPLSGPSVH
uniref:Small integral membrane protein 14 n=1 Tax=Arion vulgaris TaxID=1028688 RepID=A0A0B6Y8Z9_9EUPU